MIIISNYRQTDIRPLCFKITREIYAALEGKAITLTELLHLAI